MPEFHAVTVRHKHAAVQALIDRGERLARHGGEETRLGTAAEHRRRRGGLPAGLREPGYAGQYGIATVAGTCSAPAASTSVT
jgi:hypothetical protein